MIILVYILVKMFLAVVQKFGVGLTTSGLVICDLSIGVVVVKSRFALPCGIIY